MGKRGPKPRQHDEVKQFADGAGIEKAATTQDEPTTQAEDLQPSSGTQPEEVVIAPVAQPMQQVAACDTWRYHPDIEPRIFREGEEIPAGWVGPKGIVGKIWQIDGNGKWRKVS